MNQLDDARNRFAADWQDLRRSMRKETGKEPHWTANLVWPALALAAGVAVGAGAWWRRARKG
jgi:hypothetical protein